MKRLAGLQPGAEWHRLLRLPDQELEQPTPGKRSRWYYRKAMEWIVANPGKWAALCVEKLWLFWTGQELMPNEDIDFYRNRSWVLRALSLGLPDGQFPFGILGPLAVLGMFAFRQKEETKLLLAFVLCFMVSVVAFHVRSRYRLPAMPVVFCFSALGVMWLKENWRAGGWRKAWKGLAIVGAAAMVFNGPLFDTIWAKGFPTHFYLGVRLARQGLDVEAKEQFQKALEKQRDFPEVRLEMGRLYQLSGELEKAEAEFREAIRMAPDFVPALQNLAMALSAQGRTGEAEEAFRKGFKIDALYAPAWLGIGQLRLKEGKMAEASEAFEKAAAIETETGMAYFYLGTVRVRLGRLEEALEFFRAALKRNPLLLEARLDMAETFKALGKSSEAERQLREAARLHPDQTIVFLRIASFYIDTGEVEQAKKALEEARQLAPGSPEVESLWKHIRLRGAK
jgi:tetratricopeptide (TPR) repeat protein